MTEQIYYILRSKEKHSFNGKEYYCYSDGTRDGDIVGSFTDIDTCSKIKWADIFGSVEEALEFRDKYPSGDEFEVVTLQEAEDWYYGRIKEVL